MGAFGISAAAWQLLGYFSILSFLILLLNVLGLIPSNSASREETQETIIANHGLYIYVRKILDSLYINSYI
jgi:hypothetical protein